MQSPATDHLLDLSAVQAEGWTALWDGVRLGLETADQCTSDKRYMVVVTDGEDNVSEYLKDRSDDVRARSLAREAQGAGVRVCTIGVGMSSQGQEPLTVLGEESGCDYFPASDFDAVASLVRDIVGDVHDFYRVVVDVSALGPATYQTTLRVENSEVQFEFDR